MSVKMETDQKANKSRKKEKVVTRETSVRQPETHSGC